MDLFDNIVSIIIMIIVISSSFNKKKKIIRLYKRIEDDLENLVREKSKFFHI